MSPSASSTPAPTSTTSPIWFAIEEALAECVGALVAGAPVIADTPMVAVGITASPVFCKIDEPLTQRLARTASITRAAAAVRLAFGEAGPGAVWVVGGGPAALAEILARRVEPAFVVGLPAGFVGAAEAKDALRASGLPAVSNVSEKGGPAVAVAAFNALLQHALEAAGTRAGWEPRGPGSRDVRRRRRRLVAPGRRPGLTPDDRPESTGIWSPGQNSFPEDQRAAVYRVDRRAPRRTTRLRSRPNPGRRA